MGSPLYDILSTPYGGRSAFARDAIPKGTPILFCSGPYASTILRKFKREVCVVCLAYAFESGKSQWSVKLGEDSNGAGAGGVRFCSEACKQVFLQNMEIVQGQGVEWWTDINSAFERMVSQMGKVGKQAPTKATAKPHPSARLAYLEQISPGEVTPELVDKAWKLAEEVVLEEKHGSWKRGWVEVLSEFEIDTARFVLDGILRKAVEDINPSIPMLDHVPEGKEGISKSSGKWIDMLGLQDNELPFLTSKPSMLSSRILVYRFLAHLVGSLFSQPRPQNGTTKTTSKEEVSLSVVEFTQHLRNLFSSSSYARSIMARDHGNVFGIWDMAPKGEESEMLGWGAYVFGSFFNHDCSPNLDKVRVGRGMQFFTSRDVLPGEELCISYVDGDGPLKERREQLEAEWFFLCRCTKCVRDMGGDDSAHP